MYVKYFIGFSLLACNFACLPNTFADENGDSPQMSNYRLDRAEITRRVTPNYPRAELSRGIEGWVILSVVVDEKGNVKEPIVIDSSGRRNFEIKAKNAVKRMKYKPAALNGTAIASSDNKLKVSFAIRTRRAGAHKGFLKRYRDIRQNLIDKNFEGLHNAIKQLETLHTRNQYELAMLNLLKSSYYYQTDDNEQYIDNLKRAVSYDSNVLARDIYNSSLVNLYNAQVKQGLIADAFATTVLIEAQIENKPELSSVIKHRDELKKTLEQHPLLSTTGNIQDSDTPWRHNLYRRNIGIETQSGQLSQIEFRCANKIRRFDISEKNQSWKIPETWQDCAAFVFGETGSQFELLEQS